MGNLIWLLSASLAPLAWLIPRFLGHGEELDPGVQAILAGFFISMLGMSRR